jgi:hypothetical protein
MEGDTKLNNHFSAVWSAYNGADAVCDKKILVLCSNWKNLSRSQGWGEIE